MSQYLNKKYIYPSYLQLKLFTIQGKWVAARGENQQLDLGS